MNCVGVSRALLGYFPTHRKNLYWMCDKCADSFENSHLRAITSQADGNSPLSMLTDAITNLQSEIKKIASRPVPTIQSPKLNRWPTVGDSIRSSKRPRELDPVVRTTECLHGSKPINQDIVSVPVTEKPSNKFWLYLSRIRPDVTNEAISEMVKANLETDIEPHVVKLVAKGADTSNMSFVSFKVGLDPSLKNSALDPSSWPEGILFRQFEDYSTQKFRRISHVIPSPSPITPTVSQSAI